MPIQITQKITGGSVVGNNTPPTKTKRPDALQGVTYKIKTPLSEHAVYVTINDVMTHGRRVPFEIFINSKSMDHFQWIVALTRLISAEFRRSGDVRFLIDELRLVFDPKGGYFKKGGKYMPSLVAEIADVIEMHLKDIGAMETNKSDKPVVQNGILCQSCGSRNTKLLDGCFTCLDCGYSKCG